MYKRQDEDVAALIHALSDSRPTPFQKIRSTTEGGVYAVPADPSNGIKLGALASVLLRRHLGNSPADKPTPDDWVAHWRSLTGRTDDA